MYAYEASHIVLEAGKNILCLILLGMQVPRPVPDALELTMEIVDQVGLFTVIQKAGRAIASVTDKLRQHLLSTVKQLMAFKAPPLPQGKRPLNSHHLGQNGNDRRNQGTGPGDSGMGKKF